MFVLVEKKVDLKFYDFLLFFVIRLKSRFKFDCVNEDS